MLRLNPIDTLACAGLALFVGYGVRRVVPVLARYNVPPPIVGGLLVALAALLARQQDLQLLQFDTTLQAPLMIAFFTSIGLGASVSLLREGGPQVLLLFGLATVFAMVQNAIGVALASLFGLSPLFGVLAGSVTLTGGPATGLAFGPLFEQAGVAGASSIALAAAMAGIVASGLIGGPVSTFLIRRYCLRADERPSARTAAGAVLPRTQTTARSSGTTDEDTYAIVKGVVIILLAMWAGTWVSRGFSALGLTLPPTVWRNGGRRCHQEL